MQTKCPSCTSRLWNPSIFPYLPLKNFTQHDSTSSIPYFRAKSCLCTGWGRELQISLITNMERKRKQEKTNDNVPSKTITKLGPGSDIATEGSSRSKKSHTTINLLIHPHLGNTLKWKDALLLIWFVLQDECPNRKGDTSRVVITATWIWQDSWWHSLSLCPTHGWQSPGLMSLGLCVQCVILTVFQPPGSPALIIYK